MLPGPRRHAGAGEIVQELEHSIDVARELKDSRRFTAPVFRFLSRTISFIGLLSCCSVFTTPSARPSATTLAVGGPCVCSANCGAGETAVRPLTRRRRKQQQQAQQANE